MGKAPHVFIVNEGLHDYSQAKDFGEKVVILTRGVQSRANVTGIVRTMTEPLNESTPEDWIMVSGPPTLNIVACVLFALKYSRLNLLIHMSHLNEYVPRTVKF